MSDTPIDTQENLSNPQVPVAPPSVGSAGDPQGSAPAPVDTTVPGQDEPKGDEPDRQSRREARAFASLRRQNAELQRELGRREGREEAARPPNPDGTAQPGRSEPTEVERLRHEMAQRETERVARTFWSSAAKEAKDKNVAGFEDARTALQAGEVPTTPAMSHYVTEMADNKAALVVWLADNPEEAERIATLDPVSAGAALAKADARLSAKPASRTSTAPPPVPTVGGRSTPNFDAEKAGMDEYAADWNRRHGIKT